MLGCAEKTSSKQILLRRRTRDVRVSFTSLRAGSKSKKGELARQPQNRTCAFPALFNKTTANCQRGNIRVNEGWHQLY